LHGTNSEPATLDAEFAEYRNVVAQIPLAISSRVIVEGPCATSQIGIVGAGIAGLHLGLYLRQHDIDVTIVTDRTAEQYSKARLLNTAAHFAVTIEREKKCSAWTTG
jgi:hypothetical protein